MNGPRRYLIRSQNMQADPDGDAVLFADVEQALRDTVRLTWLLPIISGTDNPTANRRTAALAAGLLVGLSGIPLVDYAMEGCPE